MSYRYYGLDSHLFSHCGYLEEEVERLWPVPLFSADLQQTAGILNLLQADKHSFRPSVKTLLATEPLQTKINLYEEYIYTSKCSHATNSPASQSVFSVSVV